MQGSTTLINTRTVLLSSLLSLIPGVLAGSGTIGVTPHDSYSSSVGVLGCKINTNRVAYWPQAVDCNNICVSVTYAGRTVNLLRIDQSGGAYDISYDAWNYLYTGYSATVEPVAGGAIEMTYEDVDASECSALILSGNGALPLSAANSMNYLSSCLDQQDAGTSNYVAENYELFNIADPICEWGYDEVCTLDYPAENQPTCPHTLGLVVTLTTDPVYNIAYPSGDTVNAATGEIVATPSGTKRDIPSKSSARKRRSMMKHF
ncbi:hypothetical protein BX600DRAFT_441734 [Xylariales sp. PMI_506]|nr:hypothetical protein BX600DRAFT_441734 [Xylariales sp. PMI_506]